MSILSYLLLFAIAAKSNQKARWLRGDAASQSKSLIYLNNNKRRGKPRRNSEQSNF